MFNCEIHKTSEDKILWQLKSTTVFCVNGRAENKTQRNLCGTLSDNFLTVDASPLSFFGEVSLSACHQRHTPGYQSDASLSLYWWPSHPWN